MSQFTLKEAIQKTIQDSSWKQRYYLAKIRTDWEIIAGKTIAKYTDKIELQNQTLTIHTSVAALRNELLFGKDLLKEKINQYIEQTIVTKIEIL